MIMPILYTRLMFRARRFRIKKKNQPVSFDEMLVDAMNIPLIDTDRLEGKREMPVLSTRLYAVGALFILVALWFTYRLVMIQIVQGEVFYERSVKNSFDYSVIIAERGIIYDRYHEPLVWNDANIQDERDVPVRAYTKREGLGSVIGYVNAPRKDGKGVFYRTEYKGITGVEESANTILSGVNGKRFIEVDVYGAQISQHTIEPATSGSSVTLSIDAELSEVMHDIIATTTMTTGFRSGAAAIMDVHTGEIIAWAGYPSYNPQLFSSGSKSEKIEELSSDARAPLLNKIIAGTYIPGSIIKPFLAYAALEEEIIDPEKEIYSDGTLTVANKYDPEKPSIFRDWKAHGYTNMRRAIAVSGDVYFYTIGGGTPEQNGLGITKLHDWMTRFGFGTTTGIALSGERGGIIPNPQWKQDVFQDDWRLGDTYLTSIGQYGWQVTPMQMLRAYAAIANGGILLTPTVIQGAGSYAVNLGLDPKHLAVIHEGMRAAVNEDGGTVRGLERSDVAIAAKSGTAELDRAKTKVHTWVAGYFPYEKPRYSFILFMENGPYSNQIGAGRVMKNVFDWIAEQRPEYIKSE